LDEGEWLGFRSDRFNSGVEAEPGWAEGGLGTTVSQAVAQLQGLGSAVLAMSNCDPVSELQIAVVELDKCRCCWRMQQRVMTHIRLQLIASF